MFNPTRIVTPGAIQRGTDEYVGQLLAYAGLYATAMTVGAVYKFFCEPIEVPKTTVDEEAVTSDDMSEE
jgi:hypothetical protein